MEKANVFVSFELAVPGMEESLTLGLNKEQSHQQLEGLQLSGRVRTSSGL